MRPLRTLPAPAGELRHIFSAVVRGSLKSIAESEGAELLEFALALPLILVMLAGLLDFANAYHLNQKLANAAREGARVASSEPMSDITQTSPDTVRAVKEDVTTYLKNAGVNTSFIGTSMAACKDPSGNTISFCWQYMSTSKYGLRIERNYQIPGDPNNPGSGTYITGNKVTLMCPYNWTFGFNRVIQLMIPSANIVGTITITTDASMAQL